jgi:hypothetical protein
MIAATGLAGAEIAKLCLDTNAQYSPAVIARESGRPGIPGRQ